MTDELNESVTVAAVFSQGRVKPVWFARSGQQVRVREVSFSWKTREGHATVHHFAVTDGQGLYEICYNASTLAWRLSRAEHPAY